jgi:ankyrin repeat protein
MIRLCRWIDETEGCSIAHAGYPTEPLSPRRVSSLPLTNLRPQSMNESRSNTIVFEHEENQQCIIIDVTSLSEEEADIRAPKDSKSVSFQKECRNKIHEVNIGNDSMHSSPKSVEDFPMVYQDEPEQEQDEDCSYIEAICLDDYESEDEKRRQLVQDTKNQNYEWGKLIEESDWTALNKSLTKCKRQRILLSEDMIIYSERNTTVLHLAAHKAPTALILLLLDVMTTCCHAHPICLTDIGATEVSSKNYCLCGDKDGNTPLHIICANLERTHVRETGQVTIDFSVVKNLLVLGPEALVMENTNGDTPLHLLLASKALQQPDDIKTMRNAVSAAVEALTAILGMAKDIALKQNVNGLTPLHVAIANHCPKSILLKLLVTVPKAATVADNDGMNSLHYVASFGVQSWTFVEQLITAYPELIYQQTIHGDTPLHLLIANTSLAYFPGMSQALSKVLTYNNSRHTMKLLTVLSRENRENQPILVQNAHGDTPLHFCAKMNAPALLTQALMESLHAPIAATIAAEIDMTPLRIAMSTLCRVGDSHDAVGLRNAMCNVVALAIPESCETVDSDGLTPLMHAVQSRKWSAWLVKILLQADQECAKITTPDGLLALHYACQNKKLKSATLRGTVSCLFGVFLS